MSGFEANGRKAGNKEGEEKMVLGFLIVCLKGAEPLKEKLADSRLRRKELAEVLIIIFYFG